MFNVGKAIEGIAIFLLILTIILSMIGSIYCITTLHRVDLSVLFFFIGIFVSFTDFCLIYALGHLIINRDKTLKEIKRQRIILQNALNQHVTDEDKEEKMNDSDDFDY